MPLVTKSLLTHFFSICMLHSSLQADKGPTGALIVMPESGLPEPSSDVAETLVSVALYPGRCASRPKASRLPENETQNRRTGVRDGGGKGPAGPPGPAGIGSQLYRVFKNVMSWFCCVTLRLR